MTSNRAGAAKNYPIRLLPNPPIQQPDTPNIRLQLLPFTRPMPICQKSSGTAVLVL